MASTPQVGDRAPDFSLQDGDGEMLSLRDYRDDKAVVLVFNRGFV